MPTYLSPGVYTQETDNSNYAPSINGSIVGIVGFAKKGPTNELTLITSPENLINIFGEPDEVLYGQGIEAALELLEVTNQIYYLRAVGETAAVDASATVKIGGCPAVQVSAGSYGVSAGLWLKAQVYDNAGLAKFASPKSFAVVSGTGSSQAESLRTVIGGALDSDHIGVHYLDAGNANGYIVGSYAGSSAHIDVSAYSDSSYSTPIAVLQSVNIAASAIAAASSVQTYGIEVNSGSLSGTGYLVESIYPGTGYNLGTKSDGSTSGNSIELLGVGSHNCVLQVNENGFVKESFKVSLVGSGVFVEDVINTGTTDLVSQVIKGNIVENLADIEVATLPTFLADLSALGVSGMVGQQGGASVSSADGMKFAKFIAGTYGLAGGTDGVPAAQNDKTSALIGDSTSDPKTGMQALDDPSINISLALVPGVSDQNVQNALVTLAESTGDFLAIVSPPYAVGTAQDAIDWSNGQKSSRTSALSSSFVSVYWPWLKVYSTFSSTDLWLDPAIFAARQMVYTDGVAESWFAPAGYSRGRLTKPTATEVKLNKGDRDALYSGGNIINPIVNFEQNGITIFGQRTAKRTPSATDRVNVKRLMILLSKIIKARTAAYSFEPNDPILWDLVANAARPILQDIKVKRGIREYRVVCDETTNTPLRVERGELWCRVEVKPTITAEVIVFELNITNQSANLGQ
jgi:phage tail sheath protein FI